MAQTFCEMPIFVLEKDYMSTIPDCDKIKMFIDYIVTNYLDDYSYFPVEKLKMKRVVPLNFNCSHQNIYVF